MTYEDRQHEVKITFPDKKAYKPLARNFEETFSHFLEEKDSVGKLKSTVVNDNGVSLRKLPLSLEFAGDDHDIDATKFLASAANTGEVFVQLPYGNEIRCHTNTVRRSYSVVNDVAVTKVDIDFVECTGKTTPIGGKSQLAQLLEKSANVNSAAAGTFNSLKINNQKELTGITGVFTSAVNSVNALLRPLIEGEQDAVAQFDATVENILNNIDEIQDDAETLAKQTATLISLPTKFVDDVVAVVDKYKSLINEVFPSTTDDIEKSNDGRNQSINAAFFGGAAVSAVSASLSSSTYQTTSEAISAVEELQNIHDTYRAAVDDIQDSFNDPSILIEDRFVQDGSLDTPLNDLAQDAAGNLVDVAFDLKKEVVLILEQETTAINLAIEYYPDEFIEDEVAALDFVIETNKLTGDELLLIPRNRELVVYV